MGLLSVLTKEGRWTKHLPPSQRAKAEAILAAESLQKYKSKMPQPSWLDNLLASAGVTDPELRYRNARLNDLLDAANMDEMDIYPHVGGGGYSAKSGRTGVEKLLGFDRKKSFGKFPPRMHVKTDVPNIPPPGPKAKGFAQFLKDFSARAKVLREFAAANKKPLMYVGAGASALGLGLLGLHAATNKRHEELRGKTVDNQ